MRQRAWGSWVAEITDRVTHKRRWIGTYESATAAAYAYDCMLRFLHGPGARVNFPNGLPDAPDLGPLDPRVATPRVRREDREVRERLEAERADEEYMESLRREYPHLVEKQRAELEAFQAHRRQLSRVMQEPYGAGASSSGAGPSSGAPGVDLTGEDSDSSSFYGGVDWRALEAECSDDGF